MPARLQRGDVWVHPITGDRIPTGDGRLGEQADEPDEYVLEWTCPECGETWVDPETDSDEFAPAGWTSIHVPCATEDELRQAIDDEQRVIDILEGR